MDPMGVHLTGVHLMGVYLMGVDITCMYLIGVYRPASHGYTSHWVWIAQARTL